MKEFVKNTLSVMLGIFIMQIISFFFFFYTLIVSVASGSGSTITVPMDAVLKVDFSSTSIVERALDSNPLAALSLDGSSQVGILDAVLALENAASDPMVSMLYLRTDGAGGDMATLEEFRAAVEDFRRSGKPVVAYMDNVSTAALWIASAADKVYMNSAEGASCMLTGISSRLIFLKDILDAVGVNVQLIRHGKYKSAGEMYVMNHASQANLEQNKAMVSSLWASIGGDIASARELSIEQIDAYINDLKLSSAEDMLGAGLIDGVLSRDEMKDKLAELSMKGSFDNVGMVSLSTYLSARKDGWKAPKNAPRIAVIYANGQISEGSSGITATEDIYGDDLADVISNVRRNDKIDAVVFRVNSPGGSVLASDKIRQEMVLLCAEKPVVASYGAYAASGGYWISCGCSHIFTDNTTLTGSIGVFSMVPDLSKVMTKTKVNITPVNSHTHGDMYNMMRPLDKQEYAYMLRSVEDIYDRFTSVVAEGRSLDTDYVDSIGQGRVWTGSDALGIGLCDEKGSLKDAIRFAASLAGNSGASLSDIDLSQFPVDAAGLEALLLMIQPQRTDKRIREAMETIPFAGDAIKAFSSCLNASGKVTTLARLPFYIEML